MNVTMLLNRTEFLRISNELNVIKADWRFKGDDNNGLGVMFIKGYDYLALPKYTYDPNKFTFISKLSERKTYTKIKTYPIEFIHQYNFNGFMYFIMQNSRGFSRSGIERINDSIRAYIYCVMGAHAQTRSSIVGNTGPSFDAQNISIGRLHSWCDIDPRIN